ESANQGTDTVDTTLTHYTLGANVENLTFIADVINRAPATADSTGQGNSDANQITGGTGNDCLDGGAGVDALSGGAGDDTFVVENTGDVVTEHAGEGTD